MKRFYKLHIFLWILIGFASSEDDDFFSDVGIDGILWDDGVINVNEEMNTTAIIYINYAGADVPTLLSDDKFEENFKPSIVKENDKRYLLMIESSPDYDTYEGDSVFRATVQADGKDHALAVNLINVDDNQPRFIVDTAKCDVMENQIVEMKNCKYTITDDDGCADVVEFNVEEEDSFAIKYLESNSSNYPDCLKALTRVKSRQLFLDVISELDYESAHSYFLKVDFTDGGGHKNSADIIVDVQDEPDSPPLWSSILTTFDIDEGKEEKFTVTAHDGDTWINALICYNLTADGDLNSEEAEYFEIDENTGEVTIHAIDRDKFQRNSYSLTLFAYECDFPESATPAHITVIVHDINNKSPEICIKNSTVVDAECDAYDVISFFESTSQQLPLHIEIFDPDEGDGGTFDVELTEGTEDSNAKWSEAFLIMPSQAYQKGEFIISVKDPVKLDYENLDWRNILLKLVAVERADGSHLSEKTISINLVNVNDNSPEFQGKVGDFLEVSVREDVHDGDLILKVTATDEDGSEDEITYGLIQARGIKIDPKTGEITVNQDNVFDFERQQEVIVQVFAQDSMDDIVHKSYVTLTITVEDVNDVPPEIIFTTSTIDVDEEEELGYVVASDIVATDPDTNSTLEYRIDWENSAAYKDSVIVSDQFDFINCLNIYGEYSTEGLFTKELDFGNSNVPYVGTLIVAKSLSWNDVDTIKLVIVVKDLNTEINEPESKATLTVYINDINDHKPEFKEGECDKKFKIEENSKEGTVLNPGNIVAQDIDGPNNNKIEYFIEPQDGKITITLEGNLLTGNSKIDCDCPTCSTVLTYEITASNEGGPEGGNTTCEISIDIIDVNDNSPELDQLESSRITVPEDTGTGFHITNVSYVDIDVSEPYRSLAFNFDKSNKPVIQNLFRIIDHKDGSAEVVVQLLADNEFDYDDGDKSYEIIIDVVDNPLDPDNQNHAEKLTITVEISDVNDNPPIFDDEGSPTDDPQNCFFSVPESKVQGERLMEKNSISATDKDSDKNGMVSYRIESVVCIENTNRKCVTTSDDAKELFQIEEDSSSTDVKAFIEAKQDLFGFYGDYVIQILATDHGDEPKTSKPNYYRACIYNVNQRPKIEYPDVDILLITEKNGNLIQFGGVEIPLFRAVDEDYKENGTVTFGIETSNQENPFDLDSNGQPENSAKFVLKKGFSFDDVDDFYQLNVKACDGSKESLCAVDKPLQIYKVTTDPQEPIWEGSRQIQLEFTEGDKDQPDNVHTIPEAKDPNDIQMPNGTVIQVGTVYYYIAGGSENYESFFQIDSESGTISLLEPLDCTYRREWDLTIRASNSNATDSFPPAEENEKSFLSVKVTVKDVNDKSPHFNRSSYLLSATADGDSIWNLEAHDLDQDDEIAYEIVGRSIVCAIEGAECPANLESLFEVGRKTGSLQFHYKIGATVTGYFSVNVSATDKASHKDECHVKVYIISQKNIVPFNFENTRQQVENYKEDVADVFSSYFERECIVGKIESINASAINTVMNVHFVDGEERPVLSSDIDTYKNNVTKMTELRKELIEKYRLTLTGFGNEVETETNDGRKTVQTVLIVVSAALAALFLTSIVVYVFKTRNLRKLVNNLTKATTPVEDKTNYHLPNTNQHMEVGSNPVFNAEINAQQLDTLSISSSGSSLAGIEDNPDFQAFYDRVVLKNSEANSNSEINDMLSEIPQLKAIMPNDHSRDDLF